MAKEQLLPDPPAEKVIDDVEQLKVVSDPLRLQLLFAMNHEPRRGWSAKELAEQLDTRQTKLYHHLALLEEAGFIRVAETRLVSGIQERRYQVTAHNYRVDRSLLGAAGGHAAFAQMVDAVFDKSRSEILAAVRNGLVEPDSDDEEERGMVLSSSYAVLSPASVKKLKRQVKRLAELDARNDPDGTEFGLLVAFYPRATKEKDR